MSEIHRSAHKEQAILIAEAEARGLELGIRLAATFLEQQGETSAAAKLREAQLTASEERAAG